MEVLSVMKLALLADETTAQQLDGQSRICNWLYNQLLDKANTLKTEYYKTQDPALAKTVYTRLGLRNLVPGFKQEHPFLKVVHSSPLKNTALRLTSAIQTYQQTRKGKKKGKTGWPRFRSWKAGWFSLLYDEPNKGFKIEGDKLILSLGMGQDRQQRSLTMLMPNAHLLKEKEVRNLRIVKQMGVYSAVFTIKRMLPHPKPIQKVIALDPNHKNIVYGFNTEGQGIEVEAPYWLKQYDKRIDELKAKRDRLQKKAKCIEILDHVAKPIGKKRFEPSRRWLTINETLERVYAKRREQTKTFCYTIANALYREHDLVAIGDYTPRGGGCTTKMKRAMNNRSLIGRLKETLSWVAQKSGKYYEEYSEKGTTRTCHVCQYCVENGLAVNIRNWICPGCNTHHHRDENSAQNGLIRVLRNLKSKNEQHDCSSVPGSGHDAYHETSAKLISCKHRWAWNVRPRGIVIIPRGLDCEKIASFKKLNETYANVSPSLNQNRR
jgi:putative transposase